MSLQTRQSNTTSTGSGFQYPGEDMSYASRFTRGKQRNRVSGRRLLKACLETLRLKRTPELRFTLQDAAHEFVGACHFKAHSTSAERLAASFMSVHQTWANRCGYRSE